MHQNNKQNGKMKKIIVSLICCLTATLGWAQEKNAYTLFDAQGNRVDYTQMMDVLERQDVVFIGEIHNCPIAHWMEYEIVKDLYDRHGARLNKGILMVTQLILGFFGTSKPKGTIPTRLCRVVLM